MFCAVWADGVTLVTQSSLSSITRQVSCLVEGVWVSMGVDSLVISSVISNALQTGNGWTANTAGYNFRDVVPAARFSNVGATVILYTLTGTDGTVTEIVVAFDVKPPVS